VSNYQIKDAAFTKGNILRIFYTRFKFCPESVPDLHPETEPEAETNLEVDRHQNSSNVGTLNWNRNKSFRFNNTV
jgi:hypothetical protein